MYDGDAGLRLAQCVQFGRDRQRGNMVGVQVWMRASDYATQDTFKSKLAGYMQEATRRGWLKTNSIVVFPEHIGTWLVGANESHRVTNAATMNSAMRYMVLSHPIALLSTLSRSRGRDRIVDSLFRMKAHQMAELYHTTFSDLAKNYNATVVAGSIVLPSARIQEGRLQIGRGPLYNTSVVYRPDGTPYTDLVVKIHPIREELAFIQGGSPNGLRSFRTAAGKLGVLLCADSWYPDVYEALQSQGCDMLAVPSHLTPEEVWLEPWRGYSPGPELPDVSAGDVGGISEGQAWLKYAMAGRISKAGASSGMHVFFRGTVWDLGSDGHTIMVYDDRVEEAEHLSGAAIVNLWL